MSLGYEFTEMSIARFRCYIIKDSKIYDFKITISDFFGNLRSVILLIFQPCFSLQAQLKIRAFHCNQV